MITYNNNILKINSKWLRGIDFNPLNLPPRTIRVRYTSNVSHSGAPQQWTLVEASEGRYIWDYHFYTRGLEEPLPFGGVVEIIAANIKDVEYISRSLVNQSPDLTKCCSLDLSNARVISGLFTYCTALTEPPEYIKVSSALTVNNAFSGCYHLEKGTTKFIDADNVLTCGYLYADCYSLTEVSDIILPNVTATTSMFDGCTSLTKIGYLDMKPRTAVKMFNECHALEHIPNFDTSETVDMRSMCYECNSLVEIPLINTQSVTSVTQTFYKCNSVSGGALDLYNQMSTQANPPSYHNLTFYNCGIDTPTGVAELAQIPSGWK